MMKRLFAAILAASVFAFGAQAQTLVRPLQGGTGVSNANAATLTRSGAHALTLTTTAPTSLTLPTSGTLCGTGADCAITLSTAAQPNVTSLGTLTSLTSSGVITSTASSNGFLVQPATGTLGADFRATNTGGTLYIGLENSTGTNFGTTGAYGTVIYRPASTIFAISRAGTVDLSISATGAASFGSNSLTAGAGSFTTGAFSGLITSTSAAGQENFLYAHTATTNAKYLDIGTTNAGLFLGVERHSGGKAVLTGATADSVVITSTTTNPVQIGVNDTLIASFSSTGLSVTGTLGVSGLASVGGSTPANASAAGVAGTITWDASYIYVATATNTWKRVGIATW